MSTQENNNKKRRNIVLLVIALLLTISILVGISYALWSTRIMQTTINKVNSNCLELEFTDENGIALSNAIPITDSEAEQLTPYKFTIKNTCNVSVTYDVNLEIMDATNRLSSEFVAVEINDNSKRLLSNYLESTPTYSDNKYTAVEARNIISGSLYANKSISYNIRLWMDESVTIDDDVMNKIFVCKISINAASNQVAYTEPILNGTDPVITGNLIPVVIADDGIVTRANTKAEWYSYEDKEWANAVILKDKTVTYKADEVIPEDNIESYFVWIPKYSYQLWDLGKYTSAGSSALSESIAKEIQIKFGTTNTRDSKSRECTTPLVSGETGNCNIGDYMTHPAFINADTTGLWVSKFEIGYDGATASKEANANSSTATDKIIVKPLVYSWRSNSVYNFFMLSYNYERDLDSHMMKNTEWGAVAYLSHSAYGINGEVWINNNENYMTGCVGDSVSASSYNGCANAYNTTIGYNGSTTGNITGIYDMSGGAWEYVAGYVDGNPKSSGFTTDVLTSEVYSKYLDVYNASSATKTYNYRILGDATGEMGPFYGNKNNWYSDYAQFVNSDKPWFIHGAYFKDGTLAGQFDFSCWGGGTTSSIGSRLVLAI